MSNAQSSPAHTPVMASISIPVLYVALTVTVHLSKSFSMFQFTSHACKGMGWQCGIILGVSFTACIAATVDASITSPF